MRTSKPSFTARQVALIRADLERPHLPTGDAEAEGRLYRSLRGRLWAGRQTRQGVLFRTAFFDREVILAIGTGFQQIVIIGAGYDGRSIRFAFPGVNYFEVDHPATQRDKRDRLDSIGADATPITFVPVDLTRDDVAGALRTAGLDDTRPALFLLEGLLSYLPRSAVVTLFSRLREVAGSGSRMAVGFLTESERLPLHKQVLQRVHHRVLATIGEPWITVFQTGEPEQLLFGAGWRVGMDGENPVVFQGPRGLLMRAEPLDTGNPVQP